MKPIFRSKGSYLNRIIATAPLVYFPLNETSGAVAKNWGTLGAPANGSYTGVNLATSPGPKGGGAPYFDMANDFVNFYSAALDAAINPNLGSLLIWFKVYEAADWTDGVSKYCLSIRIDSSNYFYIATPLSTPNTIRVLRRTASQWEYRDTTVPGGSLAWHQAGITWDDAGNETKCFINGAQFEATFAATTMTSGLSSSYVCLGAQNITPTTLWHGYLAHMALWNRVLTPTEILSLYQ
jgi:hypothetical protein